MTESDNRPSATIYQFPKRGRFADGAAREDAQLSPAAFGSRAKSVSGAWYHDEAIRELDRTRKN